MTDTKLGGLEARKLRRLCFGIAVASVVGRSLYFHSFFAMVASLTALVPFLILSGALRFFNHDQPVGRFSTVKMIGSTIALGLGLLVFPTPVSGGSGPLNAPLPGLLGHDASLSGEPWQSLAAGLFLLFGVGLLTQWTLMLRAVRLRPDRLNPATETDVLSDFATMGNPLGTSVTRPSSARQAARKLPAQRAVATQTFRGPRQLGGRIKIDVPTRATPVDLSKSRSRGD